MKWQCNLLVVFLVQTAAGQTVVDQEYRGSDLVTYFLDYPGDYLAQTFTVRNSGKLQELGIRVSLGGSSHYAPPIDDLTLRLVRTDQMGAPLIDQVLATRSYDWEVVRQYSTLADRYVKFDLTIWNLHVRSGDTFAIALSSNQTAYSGPGNTRLENHFNYDWHMGYRDPHPGGHFYIYSPKLFGPQPYKIADFVPPGASPHRDVGFRVLVLIPEPASISLVIAGMLGLLLRRRTL